MGEESGGGYMTAYIDILTFNENTFKGPIEEPIIIL